jgi:hypothetical protein
MQRGADGQRHVIAAVVCDRRTAFAFDGLRSLPRRAHGARTRALDFAHVGRVLVEKLRDGLHELFSRVALAQLVVHVALGFHQ